MFPFKNKPKSTPDPAALSAAKQLIHLLLHQLSDKLGRYEQKMSLPAKKRLITLFCLIAGVLAMNTLFRGLFIPSTIEQPFISRPAVHTPFLPRIPDSLLYRRPTRGLHTAPVVRPLHDSITQ